jgi:hypothetical protein
MKIINLKETNEETWDDEWYIIPQIIIAENKNEKRLLKDCLTNFSVKQSSSTEEKEIYSVCLKAISVLRNIDPNEKILYENSLFII